MKTQLLPLWLGLALLALSAVSPTPALAADEVSVFTATRYITGIAMAPDGRLWAATTGGVLYRAPGQPWRKYTTADGLPSNEVTHVRLEGGTAIAVTPLGTAVWQDGRWLPDAVPRPAPQRFVPGQTCAVEWQGQLWAASAWEFLSPRRFYLYDALQQSHLSLLHWSHISALLPVGDRLWVALYNEGILAWDGKETWSRPVGGLPEEAHEITALGGDAARLWVGTRRQGLWERGERWTQHLRAGEPYDHNAQALASYRGRLYMSTLEDGLMVKGEEWTRIQSPEISSDAPRQLVVFRDRLFVRHGNGQVDVYDGTAWKRNICASLPRKEVSALAADADRLYAAQWGGWSEFDGKAWTHHLQEKGLQGVPVLALYPDGDTLWVGTQSRGLGSYHRRAGKWEWHDERNGLPDDWVRSILRVNDTLYTGTFVGGLARRTGNTWKAVPGLDAGEITAMEPDGRGGLFVGTRSGGWHVPAKGSRVPLATIAPMLDPEIQALCRVPEGLWLGTRTGLFFIPQHLLDKVMR